MVVVKIMFENERPPLTLFRYIGSRICIVIDYCLAASRVNRYDLILVGLAILGNLEIERRR